MIEPGTKWRIGEVPDSRFVTLAGSYPPENGSPSIASSSVHVYDLKAGEEDRQLAHDQDEFYLVLEGARTLQIVDELTSSSVDVELAPLDLVFVPRGYPHCFIGEGRMKCLVFFAPDYSGPPTPEPPALRIKSRDDLVEALSAACGLEHGLLVQYLYAAFSLISEPQEVDPPTWETIRIIRREILKIAREEMAHLGTVANLMVAIGATPGFLIPPFPQLEPKWFPFPFSLEPLTHEAIARFVRFERPEPPAALAALAEFRVEYDYVGELYRQIREGFTTVSRSVSELFIGEPADQDRSDWGANLRIFPIQSLAQVNEAIDFIVVEGEGSSAEPTEVDLSLDPHDFFSKRRSHYERFLYIQKMLERLEDGGVTWLKNVAANPATEPNKTRSGNVTPITEQNTLKVAQLFNHFYVTLLLMFTVLYDSAGETVAERRAIARFLKGGMSGIIRPLAEILGDLKISDTGDLLAGPPFEIVAQLSVAPRTRQRWTRLLERVTASRRESQQLAGSQLHARLASVARNLEIIEADLQRIMGDKP